MSNFVNLMDIVYPVGSIYQSMNATSPASSIGGTWTQLKTFLYGADTAKKTGGEATHTLTIGEMPSHSHSIDKTKQRMLYNEKTGGANIYFNPNGSSVISHGYFNSDITGGGKHTTTCRPTQLV